MTHALAILGTLLLIIQTVLYIPAVQHFRTPNKQTAGFNIVSELVWAITGIGWIWYAILINNLILIFSGSIVLVGSTMVTWYLWSHATARQQQHAAITGITTLGGILVGGFVWGTTGLAVSLGIIGVVQFVPQLASTIYCLQHGKTMNGFTPLIAGGRTLYCGLWTLYALLSQPLPVPLLVWAVMGVLAFGLAIPATRTQYVA